MAVTCMLPLATCHHCLRASPSAAWCPRAIPVTHTSPSTAHHHRLHVTIGRMVPPSSAHHPHITIACASPFASPSATWCPQAMPVTHTSPSTTCHHCLHITVGRMVPPSSAHHLHITVACASPFVSLSAAWCPQATPVTCTSLSPWMCCRHTQLEDAQSTIPKYDVIFMVFEEGNKCCMFLYVPSTVLVS